MYPVTIPSWICIIRGDLLKKLHIFRYQYNAFCKNSIVIVSILWCFSIAAGLIFGKRASDIAASLFRLSVITAPRLGHLLFVMTVPLLVGSTAVFFGADFLLYLQCIVRGFSFGYCLGLTISSFGLFGWLLGMLLFAPFVMTQITWLLFCQKMFANRYQAIIQSLAPSVLIVLVFGCLYYFKILLFIDELLNLL